ncbi:hypothetical protein C1H46_022121 [Malus baccata]|uniref:MADS-box domain-containing protein n=1 Tax=Malus baccata TaxID=106549 RepID=A0A540M0R9_MALBA|nr:hypothetical protein C1H46_022121 [Malus baccata]
MLEKQESVSGSEDRVGGGRRANDAQNCFWLVGLGISDVSDSPANFVYRIFRSPGRVMQSYISIEDVIAKFAQLTPQERAKRKLESLEALKKTFKKLDHDVNIQEFLGTSSQTIEDLSNQSSLLQTQLSEIKKRLSCWTSLDKINSVEQLGHMEDSLRESLNQIRTHKFQNGLHIPFSMNAEQQLQPLSWIPTNESRHIVLPEDATLLPHRDMECSASSSFGSYSGYLGTGKSPEISTSGQENGILNDLSRTAPLNLQLGGHIPYLPYNLNMLTDTKFQPPAEMSPQENPVEYQVNGSFEASRPEFYPTQHNWASTSGPCAVTMFDEHLYSQVSFSSPIFSINFSCLLLAWLPLLE